MYITKTFSLDFSAMRLKCCQVLCSLVTVLLLNVYSSQAQELGFLGEEPFRVYTSRSTRAGQVLYQFFTTHGESTEIVYSIVDRLTAAASSRHFMMRSETGELVLKSTFLTLMNHTLVIEARSGSYSAVQANITVVVVPESDQTPWYEKEQYNLSISEDTPINQPFSVIRAFSPSTSNFHAYSIIAGTSAGAFAINSSSGLLTTRRFLDRERLDRYLLLVRCSFDNGYVDIDVIINVLDSNDNKPLFAEMLYNVAIPENISVFADVLTVSANDPDSGTNGVIRFSLDPNATQLFSLDNESGVLTTLLGLDYERINRYQFTITAHDGGIPSLTSTVIVIVNLINVNDECPIFENPMYTAEIATAPPLQMNQEILRVRAIDPDSLSNITYSIVSSSHDILSLNTTSGAISLRTTENITGQYSLNISASDATCIMKVFATVEIGIGTVNNHSPAFSSECIAYLIENPPIGTEVLRLTARDPDRGQNGLVSYMFLEDQETSLFSIEMLSGVVRTKQQPENYDREIQDTYKIGVIARDGGMRQDYCLLTITLLDQNDNSPTFTSNSYNMTLSSDTMVGSLVAQVKAFDEDLAENGSLLYSLDQTDIPFTIDQMSGEINTTASLNDTLLEYAFNVTATDMGHPNSLSSTAIVNIMLSTSDSYPKFPYSYYNVTLCENSPVFYPVLTLDASNIPNYAILAGSVYSSNSENAFVISRDSIRVGSRVLIDFEQLGARKSFLFAVQATNSAGSSFTTVEIFVLDLDDNPPHLPRTNSNGNHDISFILAENQPLGTVVTQVLALDLDTGENGDIAYNLTTPSPYFNISADGVITSIHTFDFEDATETLSGSFMIRAYNPNDVRPMCSFNTFHSIWTLFFTVGWSISNLNDSPPSFDQNHYFLQIQEDTSIQERIFTFNASDNDTSSDHLSFSIVKGNDGTFAMESNTLVLVKRLDFERIADYNLTVQVTDGTHSNCFQCLATIRIMVIDIEDETPAFLQHFYSRELEETAEIGTSVLTVSVDVTDLNSSNVDYQLSELAWGRFNISRSGTITVSGILDREEFPNGIIFLVFAEGVSVTSAIVNVTLLDVNDNDPRFLDVYSGSVHENVPPPMEGIFVAQVTAVDPDQDRNGTVLYNLTSGMEYGFEIDSNSGIITAHSIFDREIRDLYILDVQASDDGEPTRFTRTIVRVEVGDDNDNVPFFPFPFMSTRIFENSPNDSHVLTVPASDLDNGVNATIIFTLISSSLEGKFSLNSTTGEVTVAGNLDYENPLHRNIVLTIMIQDPHFQCEMVRNDPQFQCEMFGDLSIKVLDRNDNSPRVGPPTYSTILMNSFFIPETLAPGPELATITATDDDEGLNGDLYFLITGGDERRDFSISSSGIVRSTRLLDYETRNSYTLIVSVIDRGTPPLSTNVTLRFFIEDRNDNAPSFDQAVYSLNITENQSPMSSILQVNAIDPDSSLGGMVDSYRIVSGNVGSRFSLNSTTGILSTNVMFDREEMGFYTLVITASDRGAHPQTGTAMVQVTILDLNDTPSIPGGLLQVFIYIQLGYMLSGTIGPVYFIDSDISNSFQGCVANFRSDMEFEVRSDCYLTVATRAEEVIPTVGIHKLSVRGRDGNHASVESNIDIIVERISSENFPDDYIVTLTINATVEDYYMSRLNVSLPSMFSRHLNIERENLYIVSIQPGYHSPTNTIDISLSARKANREFFSPIEILNCLFLVRNELFIGQHGVIALPTDPCVTEPCSNQAECRIRRVMGRTQRTIHSSQFIVFSPRITLSYECECVPGTTGEFCEINYDDCYSSPCTHNAECTDTIGGFVCGCPDGTSGPDCSLNPDECINNSCQNGGSCINGFNTFICDCLPGFYGSECQYSHFQVSSICDSNPCLNEGSCSPGRNSFTCLCREGFGGRLCENAVQIHGGCIGNPCHNGSVCTDTDDGPSCQCSVGFTGPFCRWPINNCELEPCKNGATCEEGFYGSYLCTCAAGYTGVNCTDRISACESNPCLNGGRCIDYPQNGSFSCQCTRFFTDTYCDIPIAICDTMNSICSSFFNCTGPNCEMNINDCASEPCMNSGTCLDGIGGFVCNCTEGITGRLCDVLCPPGHEGEFCESTIFYCSQSSCMNGGTCMENIGGFRCHCPDGYTGPRCELNNTCTVAQCFNGGTCVNLPTGGSECECLPGFDGTNCELLTASFSGSSTQSSFRAFNSLQLQSRGRITLEFATQSLDGLLLYSTQYQAGRSQDLIIAEVVGGYLRVGVSHGSGEESVTVMDSSIRLNDGRWHQVTFEINGKVSDIGTGRKSQGFEKKCLPLIKGHTHTHKAPNRRTHRTLPSQQDSVYYYIPNLL